MSKTVGQLKDSISGILQSTNLNNVTNLYGAIERASRVILQKAVVPEATGRDSYNVYDGVYDYIAPTYIFGGSLIDFRPQGVSRNESDYVYKQPIELFDRTKALLSNGYAITFEASGTRRIMRIAQVKARARNIIDQMSETTGWVASGSASALTKDATNFYQSPASLRFLCTGASTGILTKSTTSLDLTDYRGVGVLFLAIDTPSAANLTSITLKIGSDASNYYSVSATTGFLGAWLANTWGLVAFDLATATTTGTPVITAMDYTQISFAHAATLTNMRVGQLFIALPSPHEIIYQSTAVFLSGSTFSSSITNDNDTIMLNDAAYTIFEYEASWAVGLQKGGTNANSVMVTINQALHGIRARNGVVIQAGLYDQYREDNPSEELRTVGQYY